MMHRLSTALFLAFLMAAALVHADDTPLVKELFAKAAAGDARAQVELAVCYRDGDGVKQDYTEAMRWAHLAADRGDAAAMDFVGHAFLSGNGIHRSPEIAVGYFKAAAGESAQAAWNLGQCYYGAQGVAQDIPKALEIWKQAAVLGNGHAASTSAMVYLAGDGIPPDPREALKLATRAAELNDPSGLVVLGEMHFQAGEVEKARVNWTKASQLKPVGPTGHPEQSSDSKFWRDFVRNSSDVPILAEEEAWHLFFGMCFLDVVRSARYRHRRVKSGARSTLRQRLLGGRLTTARQQGVALIVSAPHNLPGDISKLWSGL